MTAVDWAVAAAAGAAGAAVGLPLSGIAGAMPQEGPLTLSARWWTGLPFSPLQRLALCAGSGLLAAGTGLVIGAQIMLGACWMLAVVAVPLTVTDLRHHRLPDLLVAPVAASALVCGVAAWTAGTSGASLGLVRMVLAGAGILAAGTIIVLMSPSTGYGDVKLMAATGALTAWWGWGHLLAGLAIGYALAGLVALVGMLAGRVGWRSGIALGPALLAGAATAILT